MSTIQPGDVLDAKIVRNGEQSRYSFSNEGHTLLVVRKNLTAEKISSVTSGSVELALYVDGPALFLLYRFGSETGWDDAPFSWHSGSYDDRVKLAENFIEPFEYNFRIILAQDGSGKVEAVREFSLDEAFAEKLHNIILRQSRSMFNAQSFGKHLYFVYNEKTSSEMAELAEACLKII